MFILHHFHEQLHLITLVCLSVFFWICAKDMLFIAEFFNGVGYPTIAFENVLVVLHVLWRSETIFGGDVHEIT